MALESEAQDKTSRLHNLTLQNTQLQTNNNNILQMLETYEVKVNSQNKKIKQLEAEIKDYNESLLSLRKEN
jgi:peptidoglycan hydrolase CwlO-like protein